ncbi:uncharacterized protein LOC126656396 [Mercurialis annua]|uniref:uncharacterized protein LOC126656396 n=1 Tax=Mercurialis annua TaxID=3986 RepID=UPI00215E7911|nr:uncharacterized protein LOC126656396 [Mercurialis annua]
METKKPTSKQNKFSKFIKVPLKILIKARDFYVKSMTEYSDRIGYGSVMGCPTGHVLNTLPKSYSVNSSRSSTRDDDYRELLRVASVKGLRSTTNNFDEFQRQQSRKSPIRANLVSTNGIYNLPRSYSVGIGRIDEDRECDSFEEEIKVKPNVFSRSKSYAVSKTKRTSIGAY